MASKVETLPALVECVPNVSEGRNPLVLEALESAADSAAGAALLDVHVDASHHRSVYSMAGSAEALAEAVFRLVRCAVERIDLRRHRGPHPRIGAADVVPFVPLDPPGLDGFRESSMEECVELAEGVGRRIAAELEVPVYLYGRAARRADRRTLVEIRRGEFEGLTEAVTADPQRAPDIGPRRLHPTAGATAVGARQILVAYNVYLESPDVEIAREIAGKIRESAGGLPSVQALGFLVDGRAQVSTNLLDVDVTRPADVFGAVCREAERAGVGVDRSEIVGLLPERALPEDPEASLRLEEPAAGHVLERRLRERLGGGAGPGGKSGNQASEGA